MQTKPLNENCGCGKKTSQVQTQITKQTVDPNVGKTAEVMDGRTGTINDSIRNSRGEVIGYVMNNERGVFRVFKDKVSKIYESEGAFATLPNVSGMGEVQAPTQTSDGSGDQFPTLTAGTPAAKKGKKKKSESSIASPVMNWKDFRKAMLKNQG